MEVTHAEQIGNALNLLNTVHDPHDFPYEAFFQLEQREMGHDIVSSGTRICADGLLTFDKDGESLIAFGAMAGNSLVGAAYIWARNLSEKTEDQIFIPVNGGLLLIPISQAIAKSLDSSGPIFELELGGAVVVELMRKQGIYKKLFNERVSMIKPAILSGRVQPLNNGSPISVNQLYFTLSSTGNYQSGQLKEARRQEEIAFEQLSEIGIDVNLVGKPRSLSAGSDHMAKQANMTLVGFSANDLGPVYAEKFESLKPIN